MTHLRLFRPYRGTQSRRFPDHDSPVIRNHALRAGRQTDDVRDEVLGPIVMRVASFFPFQTSYYLNGHSFIEHELKQAEMRPPRQQPLSPPPNVHHQTASKLEAAYHRADNAIQQIVQPFAA
jgi:hypothetical protein